LVLYHLRTKGLLVVGLAVLPLACFWAIVAVTQLRHAPPVNNTVRNLQVQAGLARVLNALLEADGGVRDHLLTNNKGARMRYRNAVARLQPTLLDLDRLVIDLDLHQSVDLLRGLVDDQLAVLAGLAGEPLPTTPKTERASST
jgi:CHASE3 domain sensor protein